MSLSPEHRNTQTDRDTKPIIHRSYQGDTRQWRFNVYSCKAHIIDSRRARVAAFIGRQKERERDNMLLPHMVVKGKVGSIPVQFYCLNLHITSIEIARGISDVWAGSMYWLSSKWSEQIWYELYNCFAVFEPRSHGLVCMTHFLDLLKHNDVAAGEEVV